MCGIVGYIGNIQAQPVLLDCLAKLEYRGYDSCGIAVSGSNVKVYKDVLRVAKLAEMAPSLDGVAGIGHTRWATCGEPSLANAHPHCDCSGDIAVVHNGIIANFNELKLKLIAEGHKFTSDTDTEVIPHLIEKYYCGDLEKAVADALQDIEGSYAIVVIKAGEPKLVVARSGSPLIIGVGDQKSFAASDVPAFLDHTDRVIYLEEGDIGTITATGIKITRDGIEVSRQEHKILWSMADAQKGGYPHFMLKEINEQPRVIRDTLVSYSQADESRVELDNGSGGMKPMLILACGTSYHAGLVGKYAIEELLRIPVRVELASEFSYYSQTLAETLSIVLTQSGETADAVRAVKKLQQAGCKVLAITNVLDSTISRLADQNIYTKAGPEISVAATKSFMAQLMVLYWLAISGSGVDVPRAAELLMTIRQLPNKVEQVLANGAGIRELGKYLAGYDNVFFIGRGMNYPIALEGALKLKEISYIHAEGYAAGELKHGPFALLSSKTPVIAIVAMDDTHEAMLNNIREVKTRGAPVIAVASEGDESVRGIADFVITVPVVDPMLSPVVNAVTLQLLAYYTARERGCSIDFPRNLAKSVTVE